MLPCGWQIGWATTRVAVEMENGEAWLAAKPYSSAASVKAARFSSGVPGQTLAPSPSSSPPNGASAARQRSEAAFTSSLDPLSISMGFIFPHKSIFPPRFRAATSGVTRYPKRSKLVIFRSSTRTRCRWVLSPHMCMPRPLCRPVPKAS